MKRALTEKEKKTIDLIASGKTPTEACLEAYDCKDKRSASVVASNLFHKELFNKELEKRKGLVSTIIENEGRKLVEILSEIFPKQERAQRLVDIANSGDSRAALAALVEMNKIFGEYPPAKVLEMQYRKNVSEEERDRVMIVFKGEDDSKEVVEIDERDAVFEETPQIQGTEGNEALAE